MRDAAGPGAAIGSDGHGRHGSNLAIQIGKALEQYDLRFFEEPAQLEDEEGILRVARSVNIPIAAGERLTRPQKFRRPIETRRVRSSNPTSPTATASARDSRWRILPGRSMPLSLRIVRVSPVITAISLQLDTITPNLLIQERLLLNDWRNEVITEPPQVKKGFIDLPRKPGWGIQLDEELIRKHPRIVAETPRLFRPDGAVCDW